jgi:hypothetical protein
MGGVREALEAQRKAEQEFVAQARNSEKAPKGWPAALLMFHLSMWRERLLHSLNEVMAGRPQPPSPGDVHEINDAELASGIGTPLADAAARSNTLLGEIIDVNEKLGDRPFEWLAAKTTTEAVLRNSYIHPRNHMFEYLKENGDQLGADQLLEEAETQMREAAAPPLILGSAVYNVACLRATQGRTEDALTMLEEALLLRTDLKAAAVDDSQLMSLRENSRFQALVKR